MKHRSNYNTDQISSSSTSTTNEQISSFHHTEPDSHYHNPNLSSTLAPPSSQTLPSSIISTSSTTGGTNTNQNSSAQPQYTSTFEPSHSSVSSSVSNEIGNSQFYIDANCKSIWSCKQFFKINFHLNN